MRELTRPRQGLGRNVPAVMLVRVEVSQGQMVVIVQRVGMTLEQMVVIARRVEMKVEKAHPGLQRRHKGRHSKRRKGGGRGPMAVGYETVSQEEKQPQNNWLAYGSGREECIRG